MNFSDRKNNNFALFTIGGLLLIFFLVLNITQGSVNIPVSEVWKSFLQKGDPVYQTVVMQIRFPRALAAIFGGAALAVSGLLLQIFFRNPIADPYVLGVSSGATLLVAIVTLTGHTVGMKLVSPFITSFAALCGALGVVALVVALANKIKNVVTLLVVGLMVGFMCSAGTNFLIAFAEKEQVHSFMLWTLGSFSGFSWDKVFVLVIGGTVLLIIAYLLCKPLNALLLGEDYARSMGVNIKTLRIGIVTISSALTALVTAFAGPVAFIGLAGPHLARLILGASDNRVLIPAAVLIGALVTILCDLVARLAFSPVELPISAVTSLFGAPIVIFLLLKRKTTL